MSVRVPDMQLRGLDGPGGVLYQVYEPCQGHQVSSEGGRGTAAQNVRPCSVDREGCDLVGVCVFLKVTEVANSGTEVNEKMNE